MLTITVDSQEYFDDSLGEFVTQGGIVLELEHSLASLSKWESVFKKPFLGDVTKSTEEVLGYIQAMTLTPNVPPEVYRKLSDDNITAVNVYLEDTMTATWFSEIPGAPKSREVITAELIYYWMITFQIPFETQTWHLNRLFTLIKVCNLKGSKPVKMSRGQIADRNRRLNEQRQAQLGTKG